MQKLWVTYMLLVGILTTRGQPYFKTYSQTFSGGSRSNTDRNLSLCQCKGEHTEAGVPLTGSRTTFQSKFGHGIFPKEYGNRNQTSNWSKMYNTDGESSGMLFPSHTDMSDWPYIDSISWNAYSNDQYCETFDYKNERKNTFEYSEALEDTNTEYDILNFNYIEDSEIVVCYFQFDTNFSRFVLVSYFPYLEYINMTENDIWIDEIVYVEEPDVMNHQNPVYFLKEEKEESLSCDQSPFSLHFYCNIHLIEIVFVNLVDEIEDNNHHKTRTDVFFIEREHRELFQLLVKMIKDAHLSASPPGNISRVMCSVMFVMLYFVIVHYNKAHLVWLLSACVLAIGVSLLQNWSSTYSTTKCISTVSSTSASSKYRPSKHRRKTNVKKKTFLTWLGLTKRFSTFAIKLKSHLYPSRGRKSDRRQKVKCSRKYVHRKNGPFVFGRQLNFKYQGNSKMNQTRKDFLFALIRTYLQECYANQPEEHAMQKKNDMFPFNGQSNRIRPACVNIDMFPAFQSLDHYFSSVSSGSSSGHSHENSSLGYEIEFVRIGTFSKFPVAQNVSTLALAKAGFFYPGQGVTAECFHCHARYSEWSKDDNPEEIHRRISPSCDFIRGISTDNLPIARSAPAIKENEMKASSHTNTQSNIQTVTHNVEASHLEREESGRNSNANTMQRKSNTHDTVSSNTGLASQGTVTNRALVSGIQQSNEMERTQACSRPKNIKPTVLENQMTQRNSTQIKSECHKPEATTPKPAFNLEPLGICTARPRYPNYAVLSVRMSTFSGWPPTTGQQPNELAKAGFIFAGYGDYTRCFFCGGGLRNWEPEDDPWIEHARWFPKCVFVRQNKGDTFVRLVHQNVLAHVTQGLVQPTQSVPPVNEQPVRQQPPVLDVIEPAIQSVKEIGYSDDWIDKSISVLRNENRVINAQSILEVIFGFENDTSQTRTADNSLQLCNVQTISVDTSLQQDNPHTSSIGGACAATANIEENTTSGASDEKATEKVDLAEVHCLVEENRSLRESRRCKICLDKEVSVAFLPCGHLSCCTDCAHAMRRCPICRQIVQGSIKTFLV